MASTRSLKCAALVIDTFSLSVTFSSPSYLSSTCKCLSRSTLDFCCPHWHVTAYCQLIPSFGGVVISLAPISIGVPLVVLPKFVPPIFLETIQKYKVTVSTRLSGLVCAIHVPASRHAVSRARILLRPSYFS